MSFLSTLETIGKDIEKGLGVAAPILKAAGWNNAAQVIYQPYKALCHTYGFRSFYLFGDKPVYSRTEFEQRTQIDTTTAAPTAVDLDTASDTAGPTGTTPASSGHQALSRGRAVSSVTRPPPAGLVTPSAESGRV